MFGQYIISTFVLIVIWGLSFGPVPVGWSTWVARKSEKYAETGGGVFVACIQTAAALGALTGGMVFDHFGAMGSFV